MDIAGKNVLVFGSGISGIGAAGLLEERGASVTLYDGNDKLDVEEIRGKMKDGAKTISCWESSRKSFLVNLIW